jgi:hypothetical protein
MYSNRKGSSFERLVAKIIAKHFGVSPKECYRTPLSGGHPYAESSDLVLSPELLKKFPMVVECKHTKAWKIEHLFKPTKLMESWASQVLRATSEVTGREPVIIFRGNRTPILAATMEQLVEPPASYVRLNGATWAIRPLEQFLAKYKLKGKR